MGEMGDGEEDNDGGGADGKRLTMLLPPLLLLLLLVRRNKSYESRAAKNPLTRAAVSPFPPPLTTAYSPMDRMLSRSSEKGPVRSRARAATGPPPSFSRSRFPEVTSCILALRTRGMYVSSGSRLLFLMYRSRPADAVNKGAETCHASEVKRQVAEDRMRRLSKENILA